jgi:hypothetical protein
LDVNPPPASPSLHFDTPSLLRTCRSSQDFENSSTCAAAISERRDQPSPRDNRLPLQALGLHIGIASPGGEATVTKTVRPGPSRPSPRCWLRSKVASAAVKGRAESIDGSYVLGLRPPSLPTPTGMLPLLSRLSPSERTPHDGTGGQTGASR